MTRQESTAVLGLALAELETRLTDVTSWPAFLVGLEAVERVGPGRYRFTVTQGGRRHEVPMAVTKDARDHRFVWHAQDGPAWDGELRLAAVDPVRTRVHLTTTVQPRGFAATVADWVSHSTDEATIDLQRLEALVGG